MSAGRVTQFSANLAAFHSGQITACPWCGGTVDALDLYPGAGGAFSLVIQPCGHSAGEAYRAPAWAEAAGLVDIKPAKPGRRGGL